jgi:hypothetical protein
MVKRLVMPVWVGKSDVPTVGSTIRLMDDKEVITEYIIVYSLVDILRVQDRKLFGATGSAGALAELVVHDRTGICGEFMMQYTFYIQGEDQLDIHDLSSLRLIVRFDANNSQVFSSYNGLENKHHIVPEVNPEWLKLQVQKRLAFGKGLNKRLARDSDLINLPEELFKCISDQLVSPSSVVSAAQAIAFIISHTRRVQKMRAAERTLGVGQGGGQLKKQSKRKRSKKRSKRKRSKKRSKRKRSKRK